jgi:hypothetical protein
MRWRGVATLEPKNLRLYGVGDRLMGWCVSILYQIFLYVKTIALDVSL